MQIKYFLMFIINFIMISHTLSKPLSTTIGKNNGLFLHKYFVGITPTTNFLLLQKTL